MKQIRVCAIVGVAFILTGLPAFSSGFSIFEQSAKASGQAGAFAARADDASANWYNPAALVRQGASVQVGANLITLGGFTTLTLDDPLMTLLGSPPGTDAEPESSLAFPVHLYYTRPAGKKFAWGIGINTPFGLQTEWTSPVSVSAKKSELVTVVVNPNAAFALNEHWSLGVGINYLFADVKNFSRDLLPTGSQNLTGDGDAWGYNLAVQYHSEAWKIGLTFRSALSPEITGTLDRTGPGAGKFSGRTTLDLPPQAALGFAYTPGGWEFEFDVSWAGWSSFEALDIKLDGTDDIFLAELWRDTFAIRLGAAIDFGQAHQLRLGGLIDRNPIPDETLRPSIPDADRVSLTGGYGWSGKHVDLDFYYMALFFADRKLDSGFPAEPSVIGGEYKSSSHLLGVTFSWRFGS